MAAGAGLAGGQRGDPRGNRAQRARAKVREVVSTSQVQGRDQLPLQQPQILALPVEDRVDVGVVLSQVLGHAIQCIGGGRLESHRDRQTSGDPLVEATHDVGEVLEEARQQLLFEARPQAQATTAARHTVEARR